MTNPNQREKRIYMRPWVLIVLLVFVIGGTATATALGTLAMTAAVSAPVEVQEPEITITDDTMADYQRLEEVYQYIQQNYIDDIDRDEMINTAIQGMVYGSGDKYATYFTPDEYAVFLQEDSGEYVGIGVLVNTDTADGLLTVAQVYKDSPAREAGMQTGDKIIGVDGESIIGIDYMLVIDRVRGHEGEEVTITIVRGDKELDLTMVRRKVVSEQAEWHMIDDELGYIQIYQFSGNASKLFHQAVEELLDQGAQGFVLDLRNNPGGDKTLVVEIADTLFPEGRIITLVDNQGNEDVDYSDADYLNMPLVTLINENSASASELLSGGIQDYGVGTLVGETTFGKGVAQGFLPFEDGAVLRLTMSKYLTGGGRCPQDVGIEPDVEVILDEAVRNNPSLYGTEQDNQLQKAIEILQDMITE